MLKVSVTDGDASVSKDIAINLTDVNEVPKFSEVEEDRLPFNFNAPSDFVVVNDPEDNFNGGSLTLAADGTFGTESYAIVLDGTKFYRVGNSLVADTTMVGTSTDMVIGTFKDSFTDTNSNGVQDIGEKSNGAVIEFSSDLVTGTVVEELLRSMNYEDANGTKDINLTVTLKDSVGEKTEFTRLIDYNGKSTITNLGEADSREVQMAEAATPVTIDAGLPAVFTQNGSALENATIIVTGTNDNDTIQLVNLTNAGVNDQARLIGDKVAVQISGLQTIIGSVSAAPVAGQPMTITLNSAATPAMVNVLLHSLTVNLADELGTRNVEVTYTSGDGNDIVKTITSLEVVDNYTIVNLADLDASTDALMGNIQINAVAGDNSATYDLTGLDLSAVNLLRLHMVGTADLKGVDFGDIVFTTVESAGAYTLTIDASAISGASTVTNSGFTGTINVTALENASYADLSRLAPTVLTGTVDTTAGDVTFTGDFGSAVVTVTGTNDLIASAAVLSEATVDHVGAGDIVVTGIDGAEAYNLSSVMSGGAGNVITTITNVVILDSGTDLGIAVVTVAPNGLLTLSAEQANGLYITGTAAGAGQTGGSIVVTGLDGDMSYDLSHLTAGGASVGTGTIGTLTTVISDDVTLNATTNLGSVEVSVAEDSELTLSAAQASTSNILGAGSVVVTALKSTLNANLANIAATGGITAEFAGAHVFTGNFGTAEVIVAEDGVLTTTAAIASGATITGEEGVGGVGGSISLTGLDGTRVYDLSKIAAEVDGDGVGSGTVGNLTVAVGASAVLNALTDLGDFSVTVANTATLTVTADQATDRSIAATTTTSGGVTITTLVNGTTYDFSGITESAPNSGSLKAVVTSNIDLSSSNLGTLDEIEVSGTGADAFQVTLTATQASGKSFDAASTLSTLNVKAVTDAVGPLTITGGSNGDTIHDGQNADTINGGFGDDTIIASAGADTLNGGDGNDTISGGTGNDLIIGGAGRDVLTGGEGDDSFIFTSASNSGLGIGARDVITDFEDAGIAGGDVIDLSGFAGFGAVFEFLGTNSFTTAAVGTTIAARYVTVNGNSIVEIDTDAGGTADMQIQLTGVTTIDTSDFKFIVP